MVDFEKLLDIDKIDKCNDALEQMQLDLEEDGSRYTPNPNQIDEALSMPTHSTSASTHPMPANREPTGYERKPTACTYSSVCKIDSRTDAATLVHFDEFVHSTREGNSEAGAILIRVYEVEYWLPKKLCSNLDLEEGTVYVWTTFLKESNPRLLEIAEDYTP